MGYKDGSAITHLLNRLDAEIEKSGSAARHAAALKADFERRTSCFKRRPNKLKILMSTASNGFFSAAGFLFEKARGVRLGEYEIGVIEDAGILQEAPEQIGEQIWQLLLSEKEESNRITAYWALGKRRANDSDRKKLINALQEELPKSIRVAFQIMVALGNYGEAVFSPDRLGVSYNDDELNRADALRFLASLDAKQND